MNMSGVDTADSRGHGSIINAAGIETAGIRGLKNSISTNAGFKAQLTQQLVFPP